MQDGKGMGGDKLETARAIRGDPTQRMPSRTLVVRRTDDGSEDDSTGDDDEEEDDETDETMSEDVRGRRAPDHAKEQTVEVCGERIDDGVSSSAGHQARPINVPTTFRESVTNSLAHEVLGQTQAMSMDDSMTSVGVDELPTFNQVEW